MVATAAAVSILVQTSCEVFQTGSPDRGLVASLGRTCDLTEDQAVDLMRAVLRWERCDVSWNSVENDCFRVKGDRRSVWHDQILQVSIRPAMEGGTLIWFDRLEASPCMVYAFADRLCQGLELLLNHEPLTAGPPQLPQAVVSALDG